jgi:hypothetical protein
MGSTIRSAKQAEAESAIVTTVRWRSWPLADDRRWSWLLVAGILCVGAMVWWLGDSWLIALFAVIASAAAMWQYLLPVTFEICPSGVRRYSLRRMRLVPWHAIRAYRWRPTGVIFFQRPDATAIDLLRSLFVPYPSDEDEMVVAVRLYLPHAVELP